MQYAESRGQESRTVRAVSAYCRLPTARCSRGVTLLEVIVWVITFTFVFAAVINTIVYFYKTNAYTIQQASAVASAQRGLDLMVRVIREASYGGNGAYPIISISPQQFAFYADVDADPQIEKVRFFIQGTTLMQGIVNPQIDPPVYTGTEIVSSSSDSVRNVAQNVTTFRYYDVNGAEITDVSKIGDVRSVAAYLSIDTDTNRIPAALMLSSSAMLRNLK